MHTELPPGYSIQTVPLLRSSEDVMGRPFHEWTQGALTPHVTQKLISACSDSAVKVAAELIAKCWADHDFRSLPDGQRLDILLAEATKRGRFYDAELIDVITILARRQS